MANLKKFLRKDPYIISEIGVNHNSKLSLAMKLILESKKAGANAVKFQTFKAKNLVVPGTLKVPYQKNNRFDKEDHYLMLKKLELSYDDHYKLFNYCKKIKIDFISTPYDIDSAKFLTKLGVEIFKTASADIIDLGLHKYLANQKKPVIISTGMSNIKEISEILKLYKNKKNIALLHCVSNYPCSYGSINLNVLPVLKKKFKMPIGFSDHSIGSNVCCAAIALGAKIFEKHLTLNKKLKGPDHKASMDIKEFKNFVNDLRNVKVSLGNPIKKVQFEEKNMMKISRKSLFYNESLKAGTTLKQQNVISLRPGTGISPMEINKVINRKLRKNVKKFQKIIMKDF